MLVIKKQYCHRIVWLLFVLKSFSLFAASNVFLNTLCGLDKKNTKSNLVINKQIDSFYTLKSSNDTVSIIKHHLKLSDSNKNKGLNNNAYDHLWEALLLAETINDEKLITSIHAELGTLYSIYGKGEKAIEHTKLSLLYIKKTARKDEKFHKNLLGAYYSLAVQHRKAEMYNESLKYLDSCFYVEKKLESKKENFPYIDIEKGYILLIKNQLIESETLLLKATNFFEKENKHYLVVAYSFLGDLYQKKGNSNKAISYFKKSLETMQRFKSHTDLKTDILSKLSLLYKQEGKINDAYFYLNESKIVSDSLFSARGINNNELFEIKNKYKETITEKNKYINYQINVIEKKNLVQSRLIIIIVFILFSISVLVIIFRQRNKMRQYEVDMQKAAIQIKYDKEKVKLIIETKSKELTASALQLIEKDESLDELLNILKSDAPNSYKKVSGKIKQGSNDMWEQFNFRFTEVNTDFYNRLREKHANLTPTEQKHCALIKLNFDSKEMARLLNISLNSVHISRHRIRKKIGLKREQNLSNYIASI